MEEFVITIFEQAFYDVWFSRYHEQEEDDSSCLIP